MHARPEERTGCPRGTHFRPRACMTHLHRRHAREAQLPQRGQHPRLQRHRQRLPCALRDVLHGWRRRGPPWPLNRPGHFRFRHCGGRPETELRRQRFRVAEAGRVGGAKSWLGRGQVLKQKTSPGWSRVPEGVKLGGGAKSGRRGQVRVGRSEGRGQVATNPGTGPNREAGPSPGGGVKSGRRGCGQILEQVPSSRGGAKSRGGA